MIHVMLDLETMGVGPDAAIIAIGAVEFDPVAHTLGKEFYRVVDLGSAVDLGGVMSPSTVLWWMGQSDAARVAFSRPGIPAEVALRDFARFAEEISLKGELCVWGNGSDFDNVILANAFRRAELETPWEFYNNRCYRTLKNLRPDIKITRGGTHHNALDDAKDQAHHAIAIIGAM